MPRNERSAIDRTALNNPLSAAAPSAPRKAVVLLEVVIALALFFGAAVVVLTGLHSSVVAARKLRLEARAADLAVTLLSELQMGPLAVEDAGPEAYEEEYLADWTWEVVTSDVEDTWEFEDIPPMKRVQVIVACPRRGFTYSLVRFFPPEGAGAAEPEEPIEADFAGEL
jgi:hypothetical protein